jgi:hypothetical protein
MILSFSQFRVGTRTVLPTLFSRNSGGARHFHLSSPRHNILSKQSHWYRLSDGNACHFVPVKSNPGKTRSPTIKDARGLGLVPSVTTILGIVHSQGLQAWSLREMMFAAWKLVIDSEGPRRLAEMPKKNPNLLEIDGVMKDVETLTVVEDATGIKLEDIDVQGIAEEVEVKQSRSWDLSVYLARLTKNYLERVSEAPNKGKNFHQIIENHMTQVSKGQRPDQWPEQFRSYQLLFESWMVSLFNPTSCLLLFN